MNYDLSKFHGACANKSIISSGGTLYIVCPVCGIVADVEAVSAKVSPKDACEVTKDLDEQKKQRTMIGQQSEFVDRGAIIL